ncbi:MAG: hydrogenase iron-sulfur subunit, partial [Candidatus Bathyarchaeia archaeon]
GVAYSALDAVGTSRLSYSSAMFAVRVPSTAIVDLRLIIHAFMLGADGIILLEEEGSQRAKATEERVKEIRKFLMSKGVEEERVILQTTLLPLFRVLGQQIDMYVKKVEKLGRLEAKSLFGKVSKEEQDEAVGT